MATEKKVEIRPEIQVFVEQMELAMRRHDKDWKDGWKTCSLPQLQRCLFDHVLKLKERQALEKGYLQLIYDAADVGNFAMMLMHQAVGELERNERCAFSSTQSS